jgi:regulator of protease activity HflC (stomatin/prohibitin superfamily)
LVYVALQVVRDKIYAAYYALANTEAQMKAYVCDTIRSSLCHLTLDAAFESKEDIANELKKHLTEVMTGYGISIVTALVTDLNPDAKVRVECECCVSKMYFETQFSWFVGLRHYTLSTVALEL